MYRLHDAHSGSAGPIQAAGSGELERDRELAQFDGANASIGVNDDMGWNGIRKTELVCCCETVHQNSNLIAPRDGVDDRCVIGCSGFSSKAVHCGHVIESTIDAANVVRLRESLERFVDGGAGAEVEKVHRGPDGERLSRAHPVEDQSLQIEGGSAMCSGLSDFCIHIEDKLCPNNVNTFRTDSVEAGGTRAPSTSRARTVVYETCLAARID